MYEDYCKRQVGGGTRGGGQNTFSNYICHKRFILTHVMCYGDAVPLAIEKELICGWLRKRTLK